MNNLGKIILVAARAVLLAGMLGLGYYLHNPLMTGFFGICLGVFLAEKKHYFTLRQRVARQ